MIQHTIRNITLIILAPLLIIGLIAVVAARTASPTFGQDSGTATSTPAQMQQPVITVDPGPGTQYLSPALWTLLQRHANGYLDLA